jgi:predicted CXXCH cytochrome family protein
MSSKIEIRSASHPVATIASLIGVAVVGFAQVVFGFASAGASSNSNGDVCLFSKQLQTSVSIRRSYMVKLDEVTGGNRVAQNENAVEDMYGHVQQASLNVTFEGTNSADSADDSPSFWDFGKKPEAMVGIDSLSVSCLGCHDGASASSIGIDVRNRPNDRTSRVTSFNSDHPIGMNYNSYVAANRGYRQIPLNSNKMLFIEGKVGCLTCHDPLNPAKGHLVMSDQNSALCNTCHNK